MKLDDIKYKRWYLLTDGGVARCEGHHGSKPPAVKMLIVAPLTLGVRYLRPRDLERELDAAEIPEQFRD